MFLSLFEMTSKGFSVSDLLLKLNFILHQWSSFRYLLYGNFTENYVLKCKSLREL